MLGQGNRHCNRINYPTQYVTDGTPRAIALPKVFQGDWFAARGIVVLVEGTEDGVDRMQQGGSDSSLIGGALAQADEVVHEHVDILCWACKGWQGRISF